MRIAIIGIGRVGKPLSEALGNQGHKVAAFNRDAIRKKQYVDLSGTDLVFLTMPDRLLSTIAGDIQVLPKYGLVHCSGQTRNADLGTQVSMFHPMMSFTAVDTAAVFHGCPIGISAEVSSTVNLLSGLAEDIGGDPFVLEENQKETYHVAGMFASVFPLLLLFKSQELLGRAGISRQDAGRILAPIFRRAADHIQSENPSVTITGPVPREDLVTIKAHLDQLSDDESGQELYRALTRLSLQYCSLDERARKTIEAALV